MFFFSAEFSLVTRIMFESLKFKVFKHFLASSQRYKLKMSLKTRESNQNWIIYKPYVNDSGQLEGALRRRALKSNMADREQGKTGNVCKCALQKQITRKH